MTRQIAVELVAKEIFEVLDEAFERHHGIFLDKGTSLFETLDGISAQQASRSAAPGTATIAAHVKHVGFYLDVLESSMLKGNPGKVDWGEIWRTTREVTPQEWETSKRELRATYERVLATLKALDTWEADPHVATALAMLVHTACHLGAIRQIARAVADGR